MGQCKYTISAFYSHWDEKWLLAKELCGQLVKMAHSTYGLGCVRDRQNWCLSFPASHRCSHVHPAAWIRHYFPSVLFDQTFSYWQLETFICLSHDVGSLCWSVCSTSSRAHLMKDCQNSAALAPGLSSLREELLLLAWGMADRGKHSFLSCCDGCSDDAAGCSVALCVQTFSLSVSSAFWTEMSNVTAFVSSSTRCLAHANMLFGT